MLFIVCALNFLLIILKNKIDFLKKLNITTLVVKGGCLYWRCHHCSERRNGCWTRIHHQGKLKTIGSERNGTVDGALGHVEAYHREIRCLAH